VDREGDPAAGVAHAVVQRLVGVVLPEVLGSREQGLVEAKHVALGREVHARAERPAAASHDDRADVVVERLVPEGVLEFAGHGDGEGVELIRPVEGERGDAVRIDGPGDGLEVRHWHLTPVTLRHPNLCSS
jgi:hypothetical protein